MKLQLRAKSVEFYRYYNNLLPFPKAPTFVKELWFVLQVISQYRATKFR